MKIYLVGGAVRDIIMGIEPKDLDYVVIDSNEQEMLDLGFRHVGLHFPVFLHPETGDEYALARKERKVALGYNGFVFDTRNVTLEEDLSRRDFSFNAIAMDLETKEIIDPFGGVSDIQNKIIRHVSDSFVEDPIRILRAARFVARYNFAVSKETKNLCAKIIKLGELEAVSNDRIWKEFEKIFDEEDPVRAIKFLIDIAGDFSSKLYQYTGYSQYFPGIDYTKLTKGLRMYLWLNLCKESPNDIRELKIPMCVYRECMFYRNTQFFLFNASITSEDIVEYFDKNKSMILGGYLNSYLSMLKEIEPSTQLVIDRINKLTNISWKFLSECDKKDIPDIVKQHRLKVISSD